MEHYRNCTENKTCYSIPPIVLQPAVNPWLPIHFASKLFQSARSHSSCESREFWQSLLSHIPLYLTQLSEPADCQRTKISVFVVCTVEWRSVNIQPIL
jgi:hypothetical protein